MFDNDLKVSPSIILVHEFSHAEDYNKKNKQYMIDRKTPSIAPNTSVEEKNAINAENKAARASGEIGKTQTSRTQHNEGIYYPSDGPTSTKLNNQNQDKILLQFNLSAIIVAPKKKER